MKKTLTKMMIIGATFCIAQNPSTQWLNTINGQGSSDDWTAKSYKDAGGNYITTGISAGDAFALKTDPNGNMLLRVTWNSPQNGWDQGLDVCSDNNGNIYVGGLTTYLSYQTPFVVKFDVNGNKLWDFMDLNISMSSIFTAFKLDAQTNPNSIYYVGSKNDSTSITKLSTSSGNVVWQQQYKRYGQFNDIQMDANGYPYVIGYHSISGNNPEVFWAQVDKNTAYPFRGGYLNGSQTDSIDHTNFPAPIQYFDQGAKIILGPAGTLAILATVYNSFQDATIEVYKFGSTGNIPQWAYSYDSPNHTQGTGVQLIADAAFNNFYFLAKAKSTGGVYNTYPIIGKIGSGGIQLWVKEYVQGYTDFDPKDMAVDGNGNAHIIANTSTSDIYYLKLASSTGNIQSTLAYDNQRNGGNAGDYGNSIFLDNTNHPYFFGSSGAGTYSYSDVLMVRLNTNSSLDWDIVFDFPNNTQDYISNLFVLNPFGSDYIISAGNTFNNVTNTDANLTCYTETGSVVWQENLDYNNASDYIVGAVNNGVNSNIFVCTQAFPNLVLTEFYPDGTTNFSALTTWNNPNATQLGIDVNENCIVAGVGANSDDFNVGTFDRNNITGTMYYNSSPNVHTNVNAYAKCITTDLSGGFYVAGDQQDQGTNQKNHILIQKYDLTSTQIWSKYIKGLDSTSFSNDASKIKYDAGTNALFLAGTGKKMGDSRTSTVLAKIDLNGNVIWRKTYNSSNTRDESANDMFISGGFIYVTGSANITGSDYYLYVEKWDMNGNFIWESTYNGPISTASEFGSSVVADNNGNVYVTGMCNGSVSSNSDILTMKFNSAGGVVWKKELNGNSNGPDAGVQIKLSTTYPSNPRIYVGGNVQTGSGSYQDIATLKYCDLPAEQITYSGSTTICPNNPITLQSSGNGTVTWMPGSINSPSVSAGNTGNYFYHVSYLDGCATNSDTITVSVKPNPNPIPLCMVTVDTASTHNILYWDKTNAPDATGFKIYREDLTNVYTYIGSVPVDSLSEYHDYGANPNVTTKRYRMSVVDTCGNESGMSDFHNTIFFTGNGSGTFNWNTYTIENQSNPVSYYVLYRDDVSNSVWDSIASTAGSQNVLSDPNFSTYPYASYRVETIWGINCNPTRSIINTSRSNIKTSANNPTLGIAENNFAGIQVMPNPARDKITLNLGRDAGKEKIKFELIDMLGQVVKTEMIFNSQTTIDISELAQAIYMVRVMSNNKNILTKKIVKE